MPVQCILPVLVPETFFSSRRDTQEIQSKQRILKPRPIPAERRDPFSVRPQRNSSERAFGRVDERPRARNAWLATTRSNESETSCVRTTKRQGALSQPHHESEARYHLLCTGFEKFGQQVLRFGKRSLYALSLKPTCSLRREKLRSNRRVNTATREGETNIHSRTPDLPSGVLFSFCAFATSLSLSFSLGSATSVCVGGSPRRLDHCKKLSSSWNTLYC